MAPVRLHRVSYVGELGWEIYPAADQAHEVVGALLRRLHEVDGRMAGLLAMGSCRIEKAYRHCGHDIGGDDHVLEAGLGFAVRTNKRDGRFGSFIGRDAVLKKRETGLTRRFMQFRLQDPEPLVYHNEPVVRDGRVAGYLTSGGYGHFLGAAIGLGYVSCEACESDGDMLASTYEIEIGGTRWPAIASLVPMHDPKSERMRA